MLSTLVGGCFRRATVLPEPAEPKPVWPEADRLFQRDACWLGGDGAYSIDLGQGRVLWLFGDSWIDPQGSGSRRSARMVSNSIAIQSGYDPEHANMRFHWGTRPDGAAKPFFVDAAGHRLWPGHGARLGDRLVLFFMQVRSSAEGLGFAIVDWHMAQVLNPDDDPAAWHIMWPETPSARDGIILGAGGVVAEGDHLYAYAPREPGPEQAVFLARWRREDLLRGEAGLIEWWAGPGRGWRADALIDGSASPVIVDAQTEFTVHRDPSSGLYVQIQSMGFGAAVLTRRTAERLEGPWSTPKVIFVPPHSSFPGILIYQGKAHPHLRGEGLIITYCTNSVNFSDHQSQPWLYFPRFARIDAP